MTLRRPPLPFRRPLASLLAIVAAGLLLAAAPGTARAAAAETVDQGVVQASGRDALTLRRLDGTSVTVMIGPTTVIRVNGLRATVDAVRPGFVARVFHGPVGPARLVRAIGTVTTRVDEGAIVVSRSRRLVLRTSSGLVTLRLGARTVVQAASGRRLPRRVLRPGAVVRVTSIPGRVADLVVVLERA